MQVRLDDYHHGAAVATALVNSGPEQQSTGDQIADAATLAGFLEQHGVPLAGRTLTATDIQRVHELRRALRAAVTSTTATELAERAGELASAAGVGPALAADDAGRWHWQVHTRPDAPPADELALLTGTAVLAVLHALGYERFRGCASPDCTGAFIDTSRGGRRRYCEPEVCGNRVNVAAYRARRRAERASS
ncbi:CGNR zinc finger domain-containing protein [Pseudonocardia acaciae]|uniref:CGNR zinc finger domain-containing protein n=1 Tax=Pseudonocardia acaciae TaxID=551276 RepID=UPI00048E0E51|nr:CGNR zinc finger domain-containing protein [Pseudonocardia acaciae]